MRVIETKKMVRILTILTITLMGGFLYMVVTFFRLDHVETDTVDRFWNLKAMECANEAAIPVIAFSSNDNNDDEPDFSLRFSRSLYNHLNKQGSGAIKVSRKVIGYLPEWDYGIIIVKAVAGKRVKESSRILSDQNANCRFRNDETMKDNILQTKIHLR